jgi:hypothetical protein
MSSRFRFRLGVAAPSGGRTARAGPPGTFERPWCLIRRGLRAAQVLRCYAMSRRQDRSFRHLTPRQRWSIRFGLLRRKTDHAGDGEGGGRKAAAGGQVAASPSSAGCLPVPGGREDGWGSPSVRAVQATRWRLPLKMAERIVAAPGRRDGSNRVRQPEFRRVATLRSERGPSAAGSVVARVSAGLRMEQGPALRGQEPNGSERRRVYRSTVRLWSGGPTNSGTQPRRLSYINLIATRQLNFNRFLKFHWRNISVLPHRH